LQRLTAEMASLRDGMHVLTAIVQRLDNSQGPDAGRAGRHAAGNISASADAATV
jgi:hypothetical protein